MGKIIDGKAIAAGLYDEMLQEVDQMEQQYGRRPGLTVIIVGEDPASQVYVRNKEKAAKKIGLVFQIIDDILDMRSGELDSKTTFMTFMSEDEALKYAKNLTDSAIAAIAPYENNETLVELAKFLLERNA